jgi:hypothetical protein
MDPSSPNASKPMTKPETTKEPIKVDVGTSAHVYPNLALFLRTHIASTTLPDGREVEIGAAGNAGVLVSISAPKKKNSTRVIAFRLEDLVYAAAEALDKTPAAQPA